MDQNQFVMWLNSLQYICIDFRKCLPIAMAQPLKIRRMYGLPNMSQTECFQGSWNKKAIETTCRFLNIRENKVILAALN